MIDTEIQSDLKTALSELFEVNPSGIINLLIDNGHLPWDLSDEDWWEFTRQLKEARVILKWGR